MKRRYEVLIILFIIVLTIPLTRGRGLTETNFSVLGNRGSRRICFLLWGALVGSYLYLYIEETAELAKCADRTQEWLTGLALAVFLCGIGLPYRTRLVPLMARIHVYLSVGGTILYLFCIRRLLILLERQYGTGFRIEKWIAISMTAVGVFLYIYVGIISSLLEIYVTLGSCIYLYRLRRKIEKWVCKSKTSMLYY